MPVRTFARLGMCMLVSACGPQRPVADEDAGSEASETLAGVETGASETSAVELEPCTCVESFELVCDDQNRPTALHDCEVAHPCGLLDLDLPNAAVATCVLQLLVDQDQPSRFDYVAHVPGDWGDDTVLGTFYVLGPGSGVDLECRHPSFDCCSPPPGVSTPAFHTIQAPAYFQDCIGKTDSVMAGCIFNGLAMMGLVPVCSGG